MTFVVSILAVVDTYSSRNLSLVSMIDQHIANGMICMIAQKTVFNSVFSEVLHPAN